jgi:hypothetical protein
MISYRLLMVMCLFLTALSCEQAADRPKNLMTRAQMVPVVYGLMLMDEYSSQVLPMDSSLSLAKLRSEKYEQVFSFYKTDYKTFYDSYKYYLGRPGEMKAIFDSVEATATRKRIEAINPSSHPKGKRDTKKILQPK